MNNQTRATYDLMVLMMAMFSGIAIAILAMMSGHEWPAVRCAASAIVTVPVAALAFCYRERRTMIYLARLLTIINVAVDIAFGVMAWRSAGELEGVAPAALIALALWALWQVITGVAALGR